MGEVADGFVGFAYQTTHMPLLLSKMPFTTAIHHINTVDPFKLASI
jgi:hypothetical protein